MEAIPNFQIMSHYIGNKEEGAKRWVERLNATIDVYIGDHTFDNERLAREMGVSERSLFRKLNELMGLLPQNIYANGE